MSTVALPAFFVAYNTTNNSNIGENVRYPLHAFKYCGGGGTDEIKVQRAFVYGEVKGYVGSGSRTQTDMGFVADTKETRKSEGNQQATNHTRQEHTCDDGAYAVVQGVTSLRTTDSRSSIQGYSEAEETRIYGLRLLS